ncbi:unnamed protein product, partial [Ectocarpus fasciculatus]
HTKPSLHHSITTAARTLATARTPCLDGKVAFKLVFVGIISKPGEEVGQPSGSSICCTAQSSRGLTAAGRARSREERRDTERCEMAQPGRSPEVDAELKKLQGVQSELQALAASRSQFYQQANENGMVKQELDLLEDEAPVFKLVGPVLIKQDLEEAKQNVAKRLELIEREMY